MIESIAGICVNSTDKYAKLKCDIEVNIIRKSKLAKSMHINLIACLYLFMYVYICIICVSMMLQCATNNTKLYKQIYIYISTSVKLWPRTNVYIYIRIYTHLYIINRWKYKICNKTVFMINVWQFIPIKCGFNMTALGWTSKYHRTVNECI